MSAYDPTAEWSPLDLAFERFLRRRVGSPFPTAVTRSGRLLSRQRALGHSRIHLSQWAGKTGLPALAAWREELLGSPLVSDGSRPAPLVYDGADTLALYRYWQAERRLAQHLRTRAGAPADERLPASFFERFPHARGPEPDWQAVAAACALRHRLCVITGGPGTGKTTVVAQIIGLLLEREPGLRIRLATPTGKAAMRLEQSLAERGLSLPAQTLHALLGGREGRFRHDAGNPLEAQALIVDETSMADLLLLLALFEAAPPECRIILLGDSGQLASVETGCVLADICAAGDAPAPDFAAFLARHGIAATFSSPPSAPVAQPALTPAPRRRHKQADVAGEPVQLSLFSPPHMDASSVEVPPQSTPLAHGSASVTGALSVPPVAAFAVTGEANAGQGCLREEAQTADGAGSTGRGVLAGRMVRLRQNWRFAGCPGIGHVAGALRRGENPEPLPAGCEDVRIANPSDEAVLAFLEPQIRAITAAAAPQEALQALLLRRVLCATRPGPQGVQQVNRLARARLGAVRAYYPGMPVLIEENDYRLGLMNGDAGVCLPDADGTLQVWFDGGRHIAPDGLPGHSESWALTIHKSQGSEFDAVLLLLPEAETAPLCRELAYTGATRARTHLTILAGPGVLAAAAARPATRASGLRELLA